MDPFFAFLLILGVALTAHHAGDDSGPDSVEAPTIEQPAPCPPTMAEPRMRDLTVAFERRVYLLPSGKTCQLQSFADIQGDTSSPSAVRALSERYPSQDLHHARSDG
jgi:hypothetical protein